MSRPVSDLASLARIGVLLSGQDNHMYCSSCGTQLSEGANFCEKCGNPANAPAPPSFVPPVPKKQPAVRLKNIFILLGIFFIVGFLGLVLLAIIAPQDHGNRNTSLNPSVPVTVTTARSCLSVSGDSASVDEMSTTVTGWLRNDCGKNFSYVQVTFKLFDASGDVVGTALANQSGLSSGETWRFKAHGFTRSHTYRVDDVTAF